MDAVEDGLINVINLEKRGGWVRGEILALNVAHQNRVGGRDGRHREDAGCDRDDHHQESTLRLFDVPPKLSKARA